MRARRPKVFAASGWRPACCCATPSSASTFASSTSPPDARIASSMTRSACPAFHAATMDSTSVLVGAGMRRDPWRGSFQCSHEKRAPLTRRPGLFYSGVAQTAPGGSELQRRPRPVVAAHHVVGGGIGVALPVLVDQRRPLVEQVVHAHVETRVDGRHCNAELEV